MNELQPLQTKSNELIVREVKSLSISYTDVQRRPPSQGPPQHARPVHHGHRRRRSAEQGKQYMRYRSKCTTPPPRPPTYSQQSATAAASGQAGSTRERTLGSAW